MTLKVAIQVYSIINMALFTVLTGLGLVMPFSRTVRTYVLDRYLSAIVTIYAFFFIPMIALVIFAMGAK